MYLIFPIDPGVLSLPKEATLPVWGHTEGCPAPGGVCAHPARGCVPILLLGVSVPILLLCVCVCVCVPILLLGLCTHPAPLCVLRAHPAQGCVPMCVCPSCPGLCVPV